MATPLDIGALLAPARLALGMTQRALGERVGVTQPQIARWEATDYRSVSLSRVSAVAEALGVHVAEPALPMAAEASTVYGTAAEPVYAGTRALRRLGVRAEAVAAFCRSHRIVRLEFFGSVLGDEFGPSSDVDVLASYAPGQTPGLFDAADYEAELSAIFRRPVDLLTRASVERDPNAIRKRGILDNTQVIYAE